MSPKLKEFLKQVGPLRQLVLSSRERSRQRRIARSRQPGQYQARIAAYMQSTDERRLQIGSGRNYLDGWLNTDYEPEDDTYVFLDATARFAIPDATFSVSFCEHIIEHIPYSGGQNLIRESYRILRPGGHIRVATPDLSKFVGLFGKEPSDVERRYMQWAIDEFFPGLGTYNPCFLLNNFVRQWGHLFIYDPETMKLTLEQAGFVDVKQFAPGESDVETLRGLEHHDRIIGDEFNRFETMVHQARKP